jgi:signal transduction histidine kinase
LNLNELNAQVNGLTNTIREASYNLMPSTLKDYGIISAINKMRMTFVENSKLTIDFSYPEEVYRLRNDIELALFRITQEAISNCIKHSNSKSLFIRLAYDPNFIILEIKDNGKGFNIELGNNENGQGLLNMKHRALILNGTFQIHSKINSGTIVKIKIPNEK